MMKTADLVALNISDYKGLDLVLDCRASEKLIKLGFVKNVG